MKGGGSRLNVNTDKPHSLISIKNKVLPTSPPARQSPQAPPTAARSWRLGEREPGNRWWRRAACPGVRPPPPVRPLARPPARRARLRAGHLAPRPRHALPSRPRPRVRTPRRTPSYERTRLGLPASRARPGLDGAAGVTAACSVCSPRATLPGHRGAPPEHPNREPGRSTERELLRSPILLKPGKNAFLVLGRVP